MQDIEDRARAEILALMPETGRDLFKTHEERVADALIKIRAERVEKQAAERAATQYAAARRRGIDSVQPLPAEPQAAPMVGENAEQRQARRWQLCIGKGLTMPTDTYAQLPRGIKEIAKAENITRQALAQDLNAYRERLFGK